MKVLEQKKTNKNHIFTFYITQNTGDNDKWSGLKRITCDYFIDMINTKHNFILLSWFFLKRSILFWNIVDIIIRIHGTLLTFSHLEISENEISNKSINIYSAWIFYDNSNKIKMETFYSYIVYIYYYNTLLIISNWKIWSWSTMSSEIKF